jgi:hypothetical protein
VPAYAALWSNGDDHAGHFRRYTVSELVRKLQTCGFQTVFASYIFSFLPLPVFLMRAVPSRLGLGQQNSWDRYQQEHQHRSGPGGSILARLLAWELSRLQNGKSIPFGGSCLVAAQKERV